MTNLAEHWDEWVQLELDMMLTALTWHRRIHNQTALNVGLLPFLDSADVLNAVETYHRAIVLDNDPDYDQWLWLIHRLKNGPIIGDKNGKRWIQELKQAEPNS